MHIMLDTETLGTTSAAVVTQLGWALFELEGVGVEESGCIYLDPSHQMAKRGRRIDWSTLAWWLEQNEEARMKMAKAAYQQPLVGLSKFGRLFDWKKIEGIWSHGAAFDIPILESLMKVYDVRVPWDFRNVRDTRTIFALSGIKLSKPTIAHSAEHDAITQACNVQAAAFALVGDKD